MSIVAHSSPNIRSHSHLISLSIAYSHISFHKAPLWMVHHWLIDGFGIFTLTWWVSRPPGQCLSGYCFKRWILLLAGCTQSLHRGNTSQLDPTEHGLIFLVFWSMELVLKTTPTAVFPTSKHLYGNWLEDSLSPTERNSFYLYVHASTGFVYGLLSWKQCLCAFVLPPEISLASSGGTTESVCLWGSVLSPPSFSPLSAAADETD